MAFGRLGAMGGGFGRVGAGAGGGVAAAAGGAGLLVGEANGFAVDFTYPTDANRVAKKIASVTTEYGLDGFISNASTVPKLTYNSAGVLSWSPHNMFLNSAVPATQSVATVIGQDYTVTVTGSGSMTGSAGASGVATAGSPLTYTATTTSSTFTLGGSLTQIQMNRGSVATAHLTTTVAMRAGVAVDYDPSTLTARGMLAEPVAINLALWSNDFTQATWVKSNLTTALIAGPTGSANAASTLTATAGNATALQAITSSSQSRISSVFLKRRTGSGNIDVTQDNGTTWTTVAVTSSWARYSIPVQTLLNPTVGIRVVTSGDAVDAALFQHETGSLVTSPAPTGSAVFTRVTDNISVLLSTFPWSAAGANSVILQGACRVLASSAVYLGLHDGTDTERHVLDFGSATKQGRLLVTDASVAQADISPVGAPVVGTYYKVGAAMAANDFSIVVNAGTPATDVAGTLPTVTTLTLGGSRATPGGNIYIKSLTIVPRRASNAELVTMTT